MKGATLAGGGSKFGLDRLMRQAVDLGKICRVSKVEHAGLVLSYAFEFSVLD